MAYSEQANLHTLNANADLSAASNQYKFVKLANASGEARLALAGTGESAVGVIYEGNTAGNPVAYARGGVIKVLLGATLTAGAILQSGSDGRAIAVTGGGYRLAQLLQSGVAGDICSALWQPEGTA